MNDHCMIIDLWLNVWWSNVAKQRSGFLLPSAVHRKPSSGLALWELGTLLSSDHSCLDHLGQRAFSESKFAERKLLSFCEILNRYINPFFFCFFTQPMSLVNWWRWKKGKKSKDKKTQRPGLVPAEQTSRAAGNDSSLTPWISANMPHNLYLKFYIFGHFFMILRTIWSNQN